MGKCGSFGKILIRVGVIAVILLFCAWLASFIYYLFFHHSPQPDPIKFYDEQKFNDSTPNHPLVYDLKSSPKVGEIIHISAKRTNASITSNNFCVSLIKSVDDEKNVPLKVCVQFGNKSQIVYTATWSGQMKEKHSGPNPFTSGEMLDLRFRFLKQYVQVFADRGEIGIFEKISGVHQVKTLLINGGVTEVELITKTGDVYGNTTNIPMDLDKGTRMDLMARPLSQSKNHTFWKELIDETNAETEIDPSSKARHTRPLAGWESVDRGGGGRLFLGHAHSTFHSHANQASPHSSYYICTADNKSLSDKEITIPPTYSFRANGTVLYSPSYGPGKSLLDHAQIQRPKRFDLIFTKDLLIPAFTLSFRFNDREVVVNTWNAGSWDQEEASSYVPLDDWRVFDLTIINDELGLIVYLNGSPFLTYTHKAGITDSLKYVMRIDGDIEVLSLSRNGHLIKN